MRDYCDNYPNQVIDWKKRVIYPDSKAIVNQLGTIRSIIPSTIKMYEATEDIRSIQTNLDMIQSAVEFLRGKPMPDDMRPPYPPIKIDYVVASPVAVVTKFDDKHREYKIAVTGTNIEPNLINDYLFGEIETPVLEMNLRFPVICGHTYQITQINQALSLYPEDLSIYQDEDTGDWIKVKEYVMDEDIFALAFLILNGRNKINISVIDLDDENAPELKFNISTHIHFKDKEDPVEPPTTDPEEPPENNEVATDEEVDELLNQFFSEE